jgi:hypothetical protein
MRYIANVISKSKTYKFVPWINVSNTLDNIDISVPTLIVGTDMAKSYLGDKVNYINRKIGENMFWTYKITEKRSTNEEDVKHFKENVVSYLKKKVKYCNLNVLTCGKPILMRFLRFIKDNSKVCYVVSDKMLYVSYDDNVVGISFDEIEYLGLSKKRILEKIGKLENNKTSIQSFSEKFDSDFFKNDEILISAMFCYLNS